jgi:DegV family protein with EDD domain
MLKIVTDGTADMPKEWLKQYDIHVLPLQVTFGNTIYTAGVDLQINDFYHLVKQTRMIPKTSLPSLGKVIEFYRSIATKGEEILSLHITSRLSGTFATILTVAQELKDEYRIYPFDSGAGSAALGYMCREARRLACKEVHPEHIVRHLEGMRARLAVYFTIDNLEFAYLSGRVSAIQNTLSSLLKVKPIIVLRDGLLEMVDRVRTRQRAIERVIDSIKKRVGNQPTSIAIVHAADPEGAQTILEHLRGVLNIKEVMITDLAIPVAANLGPGTIGIVAFTDEEE